MSQSRRNPKRKANNAAAAKVDLPDHLLEEALAPLTAQEIEEWEGWVELESEPVSDYCCKCARVDYNETTRRLIDPALTLRFQAFFNFIISDLGVKDVKAQEIFSIDPESLDMLPSVVVIVLFYFHR